ncbi:hypothetical protein HanRHA438_Chr12g0544711 [Helianthus annuus]|nr:hypothetical protein HanRHA438_Chr12g0544711 [Helianthus annuus]
MENMQKRDGNENVWFKDKLLINQPAKIPVTIKLDDNVEAFTHWHEVALVGRVREFSVLTTLQVLLKGEQLATRKIKYLGGMNVLLIFNDDNQRDVFLSRKVVWSKWFESMDQWKGQSFSYERIAWLKIHGVPLQLNIDPVFNVIGKKFGKVVQPAQVSDKDGDFSFVLIGVVVGDCLRIQEEVKIQWRNKLFRVWIEEEMRDWVPECIEDDDDSVLNNSGAGVEDIEEGEVRMNDHVGRDAGGQPEITEPVTENVILERIDIGRNELDTNISMAKFGKFGDLNGNDWMSIKSGFLADFNKKEKKKSYSKKKVMDRAKSISPQVQERPKKRSRSEDDPFGLDHLIGIKNKSGVQQDIEESEELYQTPDLNRSVEAEMGNVV